MPSIEAGKSQVEKTNGEISKDVFPSHTTQSQSFLWEYLLLFLIAFRLLNTLTLRTFFQPDEYFQALEPAWWFAFNDGSGAWMTWEWKQHLRAALHPALFAVAYKIADTLSSTLGLSSSIRSQLLLAAPKIVQAFIAALGDYYTYKLAAQVYGLNSYTTLCTLLLTLGSPWNWFVSTRTFSNCVETTLTIVALYNWPCHWALGVDEVGFQVDENTLRVRQAYPYHDERVASEKDTEVGDEITHIRRCVLAAVTAVILRPTNAIIWFTLALTTFGRGIWHHGMHWEIGAFLREGSLCTSVILVLSITADRLFYGVWTFPMWHFFKFNVLQSLAVFYGNNDWHYYLSQGYPLLLLGALPFALLGLYQVLSRKGEPAHLTIQSRLILHRLALVSLILPAVLSILSHKEVRFIYPILPALHILAAAPLARLLGLPERIGKAYIQRPRSTKAIAACASLTFLNVIITLYVSQVHNSGLLQVPDYLRGQFESYYFPAPNISQAKISPTSGNNLTFAVLMPCHSVPWRSHLHYPPTSSTAGISGWALTCEPPLDLNATEKESYLDEADIFYADPAVWLKTNMIRDLPKGDPSPGVHGSSQPDKKLYSNPNPDRGIFLNEGGGGQLPGSSTFGTPSQKRKNIPKRAWPDCIIFFGQLEPLMTRFLIGSAYTECTRFFNSHFHDDWRRTGDVIIYCRYPERKRAVPNGVEILAKEEV